MRASKAGEPGVPHVKTVTKPDGRIYRYHRKTGRRIRGEPGTAAFMTSYLAAATPKLAPKGPARDLSFLIDQYRKSPEWAALAPSSQLARRLQFKQIEDRLGDVPMKALDDDGIVTDLYAWRDELKATPAKADNLMIALGVVLGWARKRMMVRHNHTSLVDRLYDGGDRSGLIWTPEFQQAYLDHATAADGRAFRLALYTGARQGDLAKLSPAQFDGNWLSYIPKKTERSSRIEVALPVYLLPPLETLMAELAQDGPALLLTNRGAPMSAERVRQGFIDTCRMAFPGGAPRRFHDLRGTTVSRLFASGCTEAEVASISGHKLTGSATLARYTQRSRDLAMSAYRKWTLADFSERGRVIEFRRG